MAAATQTTKSGSPTIMDDEPYRAAIARLETLKDQFKATRTEERQLQTEATRVADTEARIEAATALVMAGEPLDALPTSDARAEIEAALRAIPIKRTAIQRAIEQQIQVARVALDAAVARVLPDAKREHQAAIARIASAVHELVSACEAEAALRARHLHPHPEPSGLHDLLPALLFPGPYTSLAKLQHQALDWINRVQAAGYDVPKPTEAMLDSTGRKFYAEWHKLRRQ